MVRFLFKIVRAVNDKVINPVLIMFYLKYHNVKSGNRVKIYGFPFILNKGKFIISDNVTINSRYRNNPIGGSTFCSFWIKEGGELIIGKGTGISNSAFVTAKRIKIGENVFIGGDCKIYDTDFHSLDIKHRLKKPDTMVKSKEIIIGDNVFIGGSTIILKGVNIGNNSVIGAGSVVTKNIPPFEIWAGNPIRFIKKINKE